MHPDEEAVGLTALIVLRPAGIEHDPVSPLDRRHERQSDPSSRRPDVRDCPEQHSPVARRSSSNQTLVTGAL